MNEILLYIAVFGIGLLIPLVWLRFSVLNVFYLMRRTRRVDFVGPWLDPDLTKELIRVAEWEGWNK